jgi:hypothetical protein
MKLVTTNLINTVSIAYSSVIACYFDLPDISNLHMKVRAGAAEQ